GRRGRATAPRGDAARCPGGSAGAGGRGNRGARSWFHTREASRERRIATFLDCSLVGIELELGEQWNLWTLAGSALCAPSRRPDPRPRRLRARSRASVAVSV